MPRISEFFGIAIYMYWFDRQKHQVPHFHARFAGDRLSTPWTGAVSRVTSVHAQTV